MTPATWIRRYVYAHPDYKRDSIITPSIAHDLLMTCQGVGDGSIPCPEILGDIRIHKIRKEDAYGRVLAGRLSGQEQTQLIQTLINRATIPRSSKVARGKLRSSSVGTEDSSSSKNPSPSRANGRSHYFVSDK
jgi:hypothetical protein